MLFSTDRNGQRQINRARKLLCAGTDHPDLFDRSPVWNRARKFSNEHWPVPYSRAFSCVDASGDIL